MNLYLVASEPLETVVCEDWFARACHRESYRITELVVARNRSQATYLAWKNDRDSYYPGDIREKPKFRSEIKARDVEGPARVATWDYASEAHAALWAFRDELELEGSTEGGMRWLG